MIATPNQATGNFVVRGFFTREPLLATETADLRKDGLTWYVSGTAGGLDGTDIPCEATFYVTRFDGADEITQNWAVQKVTVNGEIVYP